MRHHYFSLLLLIFFITTQHYASAKFNGLPVFARKVSELCPKSPIPVPLPKELPLILRETFLVLDGIIDLAMRKTNTSSASLAIVYNNEVIYAKPFSVEFDNQKAPNTTLDTLYRLGSLSKVFTVLMLEKLRDQKKVHLDDEVQTYWPNFQVQTPYGRGITFLQLARQLSGLPSGSPCNYFPTCTISTDQAFELLSQVEVVFPTDTYPHYSDVAYAILGRALERPANLTWEDFMTKEILSPLEMTSTGWEYPESILPRFAPPIFLEQISPAISFDDIGWARPTGGMYSSANDMIKLLKMFLSANIAQTNPVILGSSLREMLLPSYINNDLVTGFGFPFEWVYNKEGQIWTITKGGTFPGFTGFISMVPKLNLGMVVLSNNNLATILGDELNSLILPALNSWLESNQPAPPNPGNLTLFEGTYKIVYAPLGNLSIVISIHVSPSNNTLEMVQILGNVVTKLQWVKGNLFQMLPSANQTSCFSLEAGNNYEYISFQVQKGTVVSFEYSDTDPYYGVFWQKISSR